MRKSILSSVCVVALLAIGTVQAGTIATFADPAVDGTTPLFTIDLSADTINGGWTGTGLDLIVGANTYQDAWFTMTTLTYTDSDFTGLTDNGGTIKFFEASDLLGSSPVLVVDFDQANLSVAGVGAENIFAAQGVSFSGSAIVNPPVTEEASFAFSFANQKPIETGTQTTGFSATAAFTSSAVPEPTISTLVLLGGLLIPRKRR